MCVVYKRSVFVHTHRRMSVVVRPDVSSKIESVRKFCTDFDLPDVSPLIDGSLSDKERYTVVWSVLQQKLTAPQQVGFLEILCKSGSSPKLPMFASLLNQGMDHVQRDSFFKLLMTEEGVEFNKSIVDFGRTCKLGGIVTFMQKQGFESVVSGIKASFRVVSEPMQYALDKLDYEANPEKFVKTLAGDMQSHKDMYDAKMKVRADESTKLAEELAKLQQQLQLERSPRTPLQAPRGTGPRRSRGGRGGGK